MLYPDLLHSIFLHLHYGSLYSLSLVNKAFNAAASRLLYQTVVLAPQPPVRHQLDLRSRDAIDSLATNFLSACKPHYAPLVLSLEISGFLSTRAPLTIPSFPNLTTLKLLPETCHRDLSLATFPALRNLSLNPNCISDVTVLLSITGLERLSLTSPNRATLNILPDWLHNLHLLEFHLLENCGSVTPGVLKSLLPHLSDRLRAFSLGLSYSLTDTDVFTFIDQLPNLQSLHLKHYYQLKPPAYRPRLPNLHTFTASTPLPSSLKDTALICNWIRRIIHASPLVALHILVDDTDPDSIPSALPNSDALASHLASKHPASLRTLDAPHTLFSLPALSRLLASCTKLEILHLAVDKNALRLLQPLLSSRLQELPTLRSISLSIHNLPARSNIEQDVKESMIHAPWVQDFAVNGTTWEGTWELLPDAADHPNEPQWARTVHQAHRPRLPWLRK